jgi:hypothetical protein
MNKESVLAKTNYSCEKRRKELAKKKEEKKEHKPEKGNKPAGEKENLFFQEY